jgi:hypothetical protein
MRDETEENHPILSRSIVKRWKRAEENVFEGGGFGV